MIKLSHSRHSRVLTVLLVSLTFACSAKTVLDPQELRVHYSTEPASVDPSLAEDGASLKILGNTAEGLVGYDGSGKLIPRAAKSWSISQDGLQYEFQIQEGLKWSDGVALRAADFMTGIKRTIDPKTGAKLGELLGSIASVKAPSDQTLVIKLKKKTPHFLKVLSLPIASPQRQDVLDQNQGTWPVVAPSASSYFIAERKPDQYWILKKNPFAPVDSARNQPGLAPTTVRLMVIHEETSAMALFEQKKLDLLMRVPVLEQSRFQKQGQLSIQPFWATYYLGFHARKKPLDQPAVRCALARKVNKAQIIRVLDSGETVAESWIPPGMEGYFEESVLSQSKGTVPKGLKLRAGFDSNPRNSIIMEKIQSDWAQQSEGSPSVQLELFNQDWKSYLRELKLNTPDVFRFGWLAAFGDPISHLQALTSSNPNNMTGWKNSRYDALVEEISGLEPGPARLEKIKQAQRILLSEECVVVPIYHYVQVQAVSTRISGFRVNGLGIIRFSEILLK
ncbi:MAG: peptide ABC transporter substrate-binding protein [Bdellovibrionales bacterium]|nr:peptide ABC transporter substrate-binding protein [Bdellovibrionales bacterium]